MGLKANLSVKVSSLLAFQHFSRHSGKVLEFPTNQESFGNYHSDKIEFASTYGNLQLENLPDLPAGKTTSAFPLDYRLKVEAWVSDQALILSGNIGKGRIIIDGGYSRFYCENRNDLSSEMLIRFINYLYSTKK